MQTPGGVLDKSCPVVILGNSKRLVGCFLSIAVCVGALVHNLSVRVCVWQWCCWQSNNYSCSWELCYHDSGETCHVLGEKQILWKIENSVKYFFLMICLPPWTVWEDAFQILGFDSHEKPQGWWYGQEMPSKQPISIHDLLWSTCLVLFVFSSRHFFVWPTNDLTISSSPLTDHIDEANGNAIPFAKGLQMLDGIGDRFPVVHWLVRSFPAQTNVTAEYLHSVLIFRGCRKNSLLRLCRYGDTGIPPKVSVWINLPQDMNSLQSARKIM